MAHKRPAVIEKDKEGHRWLRCDAGCGAEFWGIGLETNKLVRRCARDLEGWSRRKMLTQLEPDVAYRWVDVCAGCGSGTGWDSLRWAAMVTMNWPEDPENPGYRRPVRQARAGSTQS